MGHKHFQSTKRPFSVIFKSKPTNQVIRYKLGGQASAKIMLERKADFCICECRYIVVVRVTVSVTVTVSVMLAYSQSLNA